MRLHYALILSGICLVRPAFAAGLPPCAGGVEISAAKIVRVEKNGALILADGRAVMLEGIRLPVGDKGPSALGDEALRDLRRLALAQPLTLAATAPKQDRYDRVRVQAFGQTWLQTELLRRGHARVAITPDRNECAGDLYRAEGQARASGAGLWAFPAFALRRAEALTRADAGSFQIVEGQVMDAIVRDGRLALEFTASGARGFAATIATADRRRFRAVSPVLEDLPGHTIRLRGFVEDLNGRPVIAISNPAQIEFLK